MTTQMSKPDIFHVTGADPAYHYRWVNSRDLHVMRQLHDGWEYVEAPASPLPPQVAAAVGQVSGNPTGGSTVTRGDLVLMRMRKEAWAQNIAAPKREARERQNASFDVMVQQANENTQRALRQAGVANVPKEIVYTTTAEASFEADQAKKK